LKPDSHEVLNNLGVVLVEQGKLEEAIECYRHALALQPEYAISHYNLGNALKEQENLEGAGISYRRALALHPRFAEAHSNLGNVLQCLGQSEAAIACYRQALALKPSYDDAHSNLGNAFRQLGQFDDALASYTRALDVKAENPYGHFGRATIQLLNGDFDSGWSKYEWRLKTKEYLPRKFLQPRWDGSPLATRSILLHAEQGLGDTLQFVRYAALIKKHHPAATVIVECQLALRSLLARCPGIDKLVAKGSDLPSFDVHAPLLSVPGVLKTTLRTIPGDAPYLFADRRLVEHWHAELKPLEGFRIGINWRGRPLTRYRDLPLERFQSLAELPTVRLISLQKSPGLDELRLAIAGGLIVSDLGDIDRSQGAFLDTAAIMANLDLVISSDTAVPHLAGALGVPVWVALPFVPDWRWLLERSDSPWYPTMRLFRQRQPGDWVTVFRELRGALQKEISERRSSAFGET
jgi:Tfp pilus assembly protein PilF